LYNKKLNPALINIEADIEAVNRIPIVAYILEVVCRTTGMGFAAVARVTEDKWVACSVRDEISFGLVPGGELKLESTICHEIRQSGQGVVIDEVDKDEVFRHHHTPAMYGFQSYISIPIILRNGQFFGTLCAIDPRPAVLNTPEIRGMFNLYADLISFHLGIIDEITLSEEKLLEERKTAILQQEFNTVLSSTNKLLAEANAHLAETQQKLEQAIETGHMGTWSINPVSYQISMSPFIKDMFGFDKQQGRKIDEILPAVHPDYHQVLTDVIKNAIEKHQDSDVEFKINNLITGEPKWVRATGKLFLNAEGRAIEYSGVLMDITERKLDDLRKNDFIGMVSHELKTPLTSLSAYAQMLHTDATKKGDAFAANALDKVNKQVKKMTTMINGFLNISRLESGKISLIKQDFKLDKLITEMVAEISLTSPGHTINTELCECVTVHADEDKIGSVISNLLSNAIKYSPKGNLVDVKCSVIAGRVQISIKDEGMGIKPKDMEQLFDRYYRVETKHTAHISGFGIGLYLSAEIVKRHNGHIWVESESGKGSTFYFDLPLGV
jgi:PAS domain S-box-containing protein